MRQREREIQKRKECQNDKTESSKKEIQEKEEKVERKESSYAKESEVRVAYLTKQPMLVLVYKEACLNTNFLDPSLPSGVGSLLQENKDVFLVDIPSRVTLYQRNRALN